MKRYRSVVALLLGIAVMFFQRVACVDIGSDTAPTRFDTQQAINNGDRIAGFAALAAGFRFDCFCSTATFDSFFPVSGDIELNFATLVLDRDLMLDDVSSFITLGNIVGQGHTLELSPSVTLFPGFRGGNCNASIMADWAAEAEDVQTVDWSYDDEYIVIGMGKKPAIPTKIYHFDGTILTQKIADPLDDDVKIFVARWHPSDYFFAIGRARINGVKKELLVFEYDPILNTITETSGKNFNDDVPAVAWHPSGDFLAVAVNDTSAELQLYSVDASGVLSASPVETVNISPNRFISQEAMDWSAFGDYLIIGTKQVGSSPEIVVYDFNQTVTTLTQNAAYTFGGTVNTVDFHPTFTGYIAAGLNGGQKRLAILEHDATAGTIDLRLLYGNESGPSPSTLSVDWGPCGVCLAVGSDKSSGHGRIEEFQTFEYDPINVTLTPNTAIDFSREVEAVRWAYDGDHIAIGGDFNQLRVYFSTCACALEGCLFFSDLDLYINSDVLMENCCITFSGNCAIHGQGHSMSLCSSTTLRVAENASLLLQDITMTGVREQRFSCLDNSSTVSLHDVTWYLDDTYSFTVGTFDVMQDWKIVGEDQTFVYQSSAGSTIRESGRLIMDHNTTFSYDPSIASNQLLGLKAPTSELRLNGATLHATSTGLRLTKGILSVDRFSTISSEATVEAEGIILGDGADVNNDVDLQGLPAENLNVVQGHFVIANVGG